MSNQYKIFVISLFLAFSCAGSVSAATFYVSAGGHGDNPSDNNSCATAQNISTPKRSIVSALTCSPGPGDILYIRGGTYAESLDTNRIRFPSGSSWSSPFTFASYPGETAIFTNYGGPGFATSDVNPVLQYIIVDRIYVDGTDVFKGEASSMSGAGFKCDTCSNYPSHIRYQNSEFYNAPNGYFFQLGNNSTDIQFINNKIHDYHPSGTVSGGNISCGSTGSDYCWGYPFYWSSSSGLIEGNEIWHFPSYGIHMYLDWSYPSSYTRPHDNIVRNNIIHDFGHYSDPNALQNSAGILLTTGSGDIAYNNVVYNGETGIALGGSAMSVYNNTVFNMVSDYGGIVTENSSNSAVKNNIFPYNYSVVGSGITFSNNLCTSGPSTGCQLSGNANYVNPSAGNFHLQSSSPAINQGVTLGFPYNIDKDGTTRPQGSAYDIGAYEYASGGTVQTLSGDLNGDKIVNSLDWSLMSAKWLTNDANSDLNKDGAVNSLDWSIMSGNWLKTI